MLPNSWPKRLVDLNVEPLTEEDLAWADCAMISAMNVQHASAREIIDRCQAAGLKVWLAGRSSPSSQRILWTSITSC